MSLDALVPGLRLGNPWALCALVPLLLWWLTVTLGWRRRGALTFPLGDCGSLPRSWRVRLQPLGDLLRWLVLVALVVALARPQVGREREKITQRGVDIMLALDVSASMLAEDVQPNRIEAAKRTIIRFVSRLTNDRVGLVVFAGRSFTQVPLTTDYGLVLELVGECRINMIGFDGTAIGDALANCIYRFRNEARRRAGPEADAAKAEADALKRSRVIVLLTDGFNNTGHLAPLEAAEMARVKNIRVHCIGLGSPEGAPVPYYRFGQRMYLQTPDGRPLITGLDEQNLRSIANITGGQYFRATDAEGLERIYRQIAEMEKHDVEIKRLMQYDERFVGPVILALGLLLVELLLRTTVLRVNR